MKYKTKNIFVIIACAAAVLLAVGMILYGASLHENERSAVVLGTPSHTTITLTDGTATPAPTPTPITYTEMTLLSIGDLMYHMPQVNAARIPGTEQYDFTDNFRYIKEIVSAADYAVANFETTLSEKEYSGFPNFRSPYAVLDSIQDAGFDMLLFANNHCYDTGLDGILRTLGKFEEYGFDYIGARKDPEENFYLLKEINGIRIGFLNYTNDIAYGSGRLDSINGIHIRSGDLPYMDLYNDGLLDAFYAEAEKRITALRTEGAEMIVFYIHWGEEYQLAPNSRQTAVAQKLCDVGVDVTIGSHPHVIQPMALLTSSADPEHQTICFYSMGNFISNQNRLTLTSTENKEWTENGLMVELTIRKYSDGAVLITNIAYIPTWVHRYYPSGSSSMKYQVVPLPAACAAPEDYGLTASDFGVSHAQAAFQMTDHVFCDIVEVFNQSVVLPYEDDAVIALPKAS